MIVNGTSADPVVFESNAVNPTAGSWVGIGLYHNIAAGTLLDHVVVRHAGESLSVGDDVGGVVLWSTGSDVTIRDSTFEDNAGADIFVDCFSTPTLSGSSTPTGVVHESGC